MKIKKWYIAVETETDHFGRPKRMGESLTADQRTRAALQEVLARNALTASGFRMSTCLHSRRSDLTAV